MNVEDIVLQETSERDYRGIVSGAESSISNIKKQLMTVQTLRAELVVKEQTIHRLNKAVNNLERRELLSSEYFNENKILIDRSRHLENALENSKKEIVSLNRQFHQNAVQSDALKGEVEALVNELSDMRDRSEKQHRELSMTRAKLVEVQSKKHVLQLELRQSEMAAIDVRNASKARDSNIEYDLETLKDRCSIAEKSLIDCEARVDNQASLTREWISKHDSVSSWLSEKKSEAEHWRRLYIEQVRDTSSCSYESIIFSRYLTCAPNLS
jgi:predicted  nucleic acid-binding Zn-ribbon protein